MSKQSESAAHQNLGVPETTMTYDEGKLILFLENMTSPDFARVLMRFPGADRQISMVSSHYERVGSFISFVRGSTGPGFEELFRRLKEIPGLGIGGQFVRAPQSDDVYNQYKPLKVTLDKNALSDEEILQILDYLRRHGGAEIVLTRIAKGSTILFIEGTAEGIAQLRQHLKSLPVGIELTLKQSSGDSRQIAFVIEVSSGNITVSPGEQPMATRGSETPYSRRTGQPRENHYHQSDFQSLIKSIIDKHIPDERLIFIARGKKWVEEVYEQGRVQTSSATGANLKAIDPDSIKQIVEVIGVINATFTLLNTVLKTITAAQGVDIASNWKEELIKAGVPADKAEAISKGMEKDVAELISRSTSKDSE